MREHFPPSQLFFEEGEQSKVIWSQAGTVEGMGQNLDVFLLREGHSDHGFVGFVQLWSPFFSGNVGDITFLIMSNNHMVIRSIQFCAW